ncbi:effector-associated domain EAD1-containing protein [Limnospira fusiformis KN01]|uniref:nSTAND1 domain-containing NTPase n=1 Tax=Limnospira TaxID=2596745 RepID=UPI0016589796|nr:MULTISPECIES: effector-associated domain EAD1-containing protein [Limnospira]MDT9200621.1 effector-associated domain EAD1-containing protein [Limnospira sp. PMC 1042.18]ULB46435.1 effector-associated domain EAD1-containing protein [Limnospira fusiformis KN01]
MKLTGNDLKQLVDTMLQAYPNKSDLEMMVRFSLDQSLDQIAGGQTIRDIVCNLITWAESRGKLQDLLNAVSQARPNNTELKETVNQLLNKYFSIEITNPPLQDSQCPYKGLFAFTKDDANFFFGREEFTRTLVNAVQNQPFLAIIGNSGMGKSSVVFAGLIPKLENLGNWDFIIFRPSNNPISQIAESLLNHLKATTNEARRIKQKEKYVAKFRTKELTLQEFLDDEITEANTKNRLLIIIDQFEEIYTLSPEDQREIFIEQLLEVINNQSNKEIADIVIVITLRVDFLGFALDYQPLAEILQNFKPETLIGMSQEELKSAIEKPAEAVGLKIENGLTNIILNDVISNPGELPLLEFALAELWKKRYNNQLTIATYEEIGGVKEALAKYAESIYQQLDEDEQQRVKHIFTQLVRFGEQTENTRRLATDSQIGAKNWDLVTDLAHDRLVITGYDETQKQRTVEVVHEVLIRGWKRLQEWMEEDQTFRKWQDRLRFEIKTWEETNRNNSVLLRGALLVEAEDWLKIKSECITDQTEIEFINASRQYQEQEDIANIQNLLELSEKELQLKQQLCSLFYAVKAGVKLGNIKYPSEELKRTVIERLDQGSYGISEQNQFIGHTNEIINVAFNQDSSIIVSASDDHTIKLWNLKGKLLNTLHGHTGRVWGVSISPNSQIIASGSVDAKIRLWNMIEDGQCLELENASGVYGVSFSPDGQIIASCSADNTVKLWSIDGQLLNTLEGHTERVYRVSFSPNSQMIASCSADNTIKLWSIDGQLLNTLEGHTDRVYGVSFSPDGQMIVSGSVDKTARLWSIDGQLLNTLEGHTERIYAVTISSNGQMIASASVDKTVKLWSIDGRLLRTCEGHIGQVWGVSFSSDNQMIASASADRSIRLWNLSEKDLKILEGHSGRVYTVSISPDGQIIASGSFDGTINLWNIDGKLLNTLKGHSDRVYEVYFSPDSQMIASCSVDKTVKLWGRDGKLLRTLKGHIDRINGVCFSPNGQMIASASDDRTVKLWDGDGNLLKTIEGHTNRIRAVSFSPDSQMIASASVDKTIKLWGVDGQLLNTLKGHIDRINGVSFSPNGQMIASASDDNTIKLWNIDGKLLKTIEGHTERVYKVSFSPDGQMIVSGSFDGTIKLWSIDGKILRTIKRHTDRVYGVSFSPDGQMIASASADKTVRLWHITPDDLILDLNIKLNNLLKKGCNWIRDYVKTNPNVSENDRNLCDDYC